MATMVKSVMLKITASDGDSQAKLDKITAKAEELGRQHPEIKVRIEAAAASAKLAVLRKELKDTSAAADDSKTGLRGRLMALGSTASVVSGLGDVMGVFNAEASMGSRVMSGLSLATGLLEAPMAGLVVGVGGLAAGIASAGMGLGVFATVAKSAYASVTPAVTAYETAINTTGKASATAMKQYHAYMGALSGPQKEMARSVIGAKDAWNSFVSSNTAGVGRIMSQGMGLLPKVFASMQPFMAPVEHALHGIIGQLGKGLGSSGFTSFIGSMAKSSGPMLTNLAGAIGHVVVGIGGILKAFLPMAGTMTGGLDKITAKFAHWGQTLSSHSGFQSLVSMAKQDMPLVIQVVKNLGGAIVHLGGSMTGLSTFSNSKALLQLAVPLSKALDVLVNLNPALTRTALYAVAAGGAFSKMKPAISGITSGVQVIKGLSAGFRDASAAAKLAADGTKEFTLGTKIASAATKVWTGVQAAFDVVMALNPVTLIIIGIVALIAIIVVCVIKFKAFREFWVKLWHDAQHLFGEAVDWIKSHWKLLPIIILGPIGIVVTIVLTHFTQIKRGAMSLIHDVTSFFSSLPHKILAAVGDLGRLLWQGGVNIVKGLIGGITSMAGAVGHAIGGIVSDVRNFLPFSPAKKGPLSGSGSPDIAGRKIGQMFAGGIGASSPLVAAAAARMAGAAAVHGGYGRAGAGGGQAPVVIEFRTGGGQMDQLLLLLLRGAIRTRGGNVQTVLGH